MLKSPQQQGALLGPLPEPRARPVFSADNYSADDEEQVIEDYRVHDDVLDLSCKVKKEEEQQPSAGVKRGRSDDEGDSGAKKLKVVLEGGKRKKHLRKKRRDLGTHVHVSGRPSVISFAGVGGNQGTDGSSSTDEEEGAEVRVFAYRRRKRRVFVRESDLGGFDVDEHFRRSLGGVLWERVAGSVNGGTPPPLENKEGASVRLIIEDSIKPSDVDDHFAKALGSETWSKIVASSSGKNGSPPPPPTQKPVVSTTTPTPPPPQPPVSTISSASNSYKIDAILGNTSSSSDKRVA